MEMTQELQRDILELNSYGLSTRIIAELVSMQNPLTHKQVWGIIRRLRKRNSNINETIVQEVINDTSLRAVTTQEQTIGEVKLETPIIGDEVKPKKVSRFI